jgi:probable HAF family extracellular repeat protein
MKTLIAGFVLGAACLVPASMFAQTAYTEGLVTGIPLPQATGIDDNDQVVGYFEDNQGYGHGFLLSGGVLTQIDQPGANLTAALAINSVKGIAGLEYTTIGQFGMLDSSLSFQVPNGGYGITIYGLNSVGSFVGLDVNNHPFINIKGAYKAVKPPMCNGLPTPVGVYVTGINKHNDFVGYCYGQGSSTVTGFARVGGVYQTVGVFASNTYPVGINDAGTIAGWFVDGSNINHGFILSGGTPVQFDYSGSTQGTQIFGINNKGSVTGLALNGSNWTGFYAFAN